MQIKAVRLDAHLARDLHGRAAADHRIGKDAANKKSPFAAAIVPLHVKTNWVTPDILSSSIEFSMNALPSGRTRWA
jgi:hypothetical protein